MSEELKMCAIHFRDTHLMHYASEYYDPVKAHEYYMRTRESHPRERKGTLNDEGKMVRDYVKNQINEKRDNQLKSEDEIKKGKIDAAQATKKSEIASARDKRDTAVKQYTQKMKNEISSLSKKLKNMSKAEKAAKKDEIQEQIARLRETNASKKAELTEAYKKTSETSTEKYKTESVKARETNAANKKQIRDTAKETYENELDKIYAEDKYLKPKKEKNPSTKSSSPAPVKKKPTYRLVTGDRSKATGIIGKIKD